MKLPRYVVLDKPVGQTPLEAIGQWRQRNPEYAGVAASYAGRLDPMASGALLVLLGEECKKQKEYTGLDKEYEIEVLLDLSTDTGDLLGLPSLSPTHGAKTVPYMELFPALTKMTGSHSVPYPAFSSKTVSGKPLFLYALEGTLGAITIPEHEETIYRITLLGQESIPSEVLATRIQDSLRVVPKSDEPSKVLGADFRQDEVRRVWRELLASNPAREFCVLRLRVTCTSGTYMRTLAARIAEELGTMGLALSIRRTRIGRFLQLYLGMGFWIKSYR